MLFGMICAVSFFSLQSDKYKDLEKKVNKNDNQIVMNPRRQET